MGVAVIAYAKLTPYAELSDELRQELGDGDYLEIANPPEYATYLSPLEPGRYLAPEVSKQDLGGYQYFDEWCKWLGEAFETTTSGKFAEFIEFRATSDGFIGPFAVRSIYGDFNREQSELQAVAERTVDDVEKRNGYVDTYFQLLRCFEDAGYNGVVQFT